MAFNDIQSDYYQIPSEDKDKIKEAEEKIRESLKDKPLEVNQENVQQETPQLINGEINKEENENIVKNEIEKKNIEKKLKLPLV